MQNNLELKEVTNELIKIDDQALICEVWQQLRKDFMLAGIIGLPEEIPSSSNNLIFILQAFITKVKNKITNWDNLNYRIDIPSSIDFVTLSDQEYAQVLAYRVLQKIWIRKQFSSLPKQASFVKKPLP